VNFVKTPFTSFFSVVLNPPKPIVVLSTSYPFLQTFSATLAAESFGVVIDSVFFDASPPHALNRAIEATDRNIFFHFTVFYIYKFKTK